jgi:molecular chaperone HscB
VKPQEKKRSAFETFGLRPSFSLDETALESRYYELSKQLHPDRFGTAVAAEKMRSLELSANLNQDYLALRQPEARLETLLREAGALNDGERSANQNQIPSELAEEYFEIQEAMMDDPESGLGRVTEFRKKVDAQKIALTDKLYDLAKKTDWSSPQSRDIEALVKLRRERSYLRSMLENLARLRT